jgi:hypothetical protein
VLEACSAARSAELLNISWDEVDGIKQRAVRRGLARRQLKRVKERVHSGPPKAGRPWTKDEEQRMLQQFDAKVDVAAIAQELNRTTGAIWARLEKIGHIQRKDFAGSTPCPPRTGSRPIEEPARDPGGKDDPLPF